MFTAPCNLIYHPTVSPIIYWPTSVIDNPGTGVITNSQYVYDKDINTFGYWSNGSSNPSINSIFSFSSASIADKNKFLIELAWPYTYVFPYNNSFYIYMSIDNGVSYPFSIFVNMGAVFHLDYTRYEQPIPDGIVISDCKFKVVTATGIFTDAMVNQITIQ